jgi:hypothetical protein
MCIDYVRNSCGGAEYDRGSSWLAELGGASTFAGDYGANHVIDCSTEVDEFVSKSLELMLRIPPSFPITAKETGLLGELF